MKGRIKKRKPVLNLTMQQVILTFYIAEQSITKSYSTDCMEREKGKDKRIKPVLYPTIQLAIIFITPNMNFLS